MLPLGSLGGFHFRMIWEEELDEEMGSSGTEGSGETTQKYQRNMFNKSEGLMLGRDSILMFVYPPHLYQ